MPYVAKHLLCGPTFICQQGSTLVGCPPALLKQFIKDGVVDLVGEPETVMEGLSDMFTDVLTTMTRAELIEVYKLNDLKNIFKPLNTWTDEQFRAMIRSVTEPDTIKIPGVTGVTS